MDLLEARGAAAEGGGVVALVACFPALFFALGTLVGGGENAEVVYTAPQSSGTMTAARPSGPRG